MADVKWIKIVTDIFDNRKVKQIESLPDGDSILVIWFKLICLAGSINDNGMVYLTPEIPYTEDMLATQFRRPLPTVKLALSTFIKFGMIEVVDDFLCLPSWEKYQSADKLARIRSKNAERQARFRERKQHEIAESNVTPSLPVTSRVTPSNAVEEDIDIEEEIERDINKGAPDEPPLPPPPPEPKPAKGIEFGSLSPRMIASVEKWLQYKKERRESYKPTGLNALISQIENNVDRYGEDAVLELIASCMAANWRGIIFDKLKNQQQPGRGHARGPEGNIFAEMLNEGGGAL